MARGRCTRATLAAHDLADLSCQIQGSSAHGRPRRCAWAREALASYEVMDAPLNAFTIVVARRGRARAVAAAPRGHEVVRAAQQRLSLDWTNSAGSARVRRHHALRCTTWEDVDGARAVVPGLLAPLGERRLRSGAARHRVHH